MPVYWCIVYSIMSTIKIWEHHHRDTRPEAILFSRRFARFSQRSNLPEELCNIPQQYFENLMGGLNTVNHENWFYGVF